MDEKYLRDLAEQYAPKVMLYSTDPYRSSSIEWYVERCKLYKRDDGSFRKTVNVDELGNYQKPPGGGDTPYYLMPDADTRNGDPASAKFYVHIRPAPKQSKSEDFLDIQYWFFYPYNGGIAPIVQREKVGEHVGDWEHVTVRLKSWRPGKKGRAIVGVFYASHDDEGAWFTRRSPTPSEGCYSCVDGTDHPVVYSSWHSHASYAWSGSHWRRGWARPFWDYTDDEGPAWGPDGVVDVCWIDDSLGVNLTQQDWLRYWGVWGESLSAWGGIWGGSPGTPLMQASWRDDGNNGFLKEFKAIQEIGDGWDEKAYTTCVRLGYAVDRSVLAVARNYFEHARGFLYGWDPEKRKFEELDTIGDTWGPDRYAHSLDVGILDDKEVLCVGRNEGGGDRVIVYEIDPSSGKLGEIAAAGDNWGVDQAAKCVATGLWSTGFALAVGRSGGSGDRFIIYELRDGKLDAVARGGSKWGPGRDVEAIAFGMADDRSPAIAVARRAGDHQRVAVYVWRDGELKRFCSMGEKWGSDRYAPALCFGTLDDNTEVLFVGRNAGRNQGNDRYLAYPLVEGDDVQPLLTGGNDWDVSQSCTSLAFMSLNGLPALVVGRDAADAGDVPLLMVMQYDPQKKKFVEVDTAGKNWGRSRGATSVAAGPVDGQLMVVAGRTFGNNARVVVYDAEP